MKASLNTYSRSFQSIYTQGDAPTLKLQGDGNLVFGIEYSYWGCVAVPSTQGGKLTTSERRDYRLLQITDSNEDVLWKFGRSCYPDAEDSCVSVLDKDGRLSWNEHICTFDSEGNIEYKFGLSKDGLLGLWKLGLGLNWRPAGGGHLRGEYMDIKYGLLLLLYNYDPISTCWVAGRLFL
jgi:hypothetical protein